MSLSAELQSQPSDILIVDDVLENVRLLSEILSEAGFSVRQAVNGAMALMAIKASPPDLLLLDINMPDMDGYAICQQLKASPETQDIPIIFLSALDSSDHKVKAFELGATDYITKPFYQDEVLKRVQNQLQIRQLTQALETQNQTLAAALQYLKNNQAEMIQHEKMAGLNQLISGVAHEVNNPISFILGNLDHAQDYFQTLQQMILVNRRDTSVPTTADKDEVDFILEDFPNLLTSMRVGAERIGAVVQALQAFAHHGEVGSKAIDVQQTIDSILVLLQPQLRATNQRPSIAIDCQYGQIPHVICDAQLIGQVFLNLLNNAIEAIDARWNLESTEPLLEPRSPQITIATQVVNTQWVEIAIADNGIGIPEDIQSRIYDPFFTTKPFGTAKGLGLATSYRVITENHQGNLSFGTTYLQGTQFRIRLPLDRTS